MKTLTRALIERSLAGTQPARADIDAEQTARGDLPVELRVRGRRLIPAAVLVPLLERSDGLRVLLTERAADLAQHAGQIAFPGGRIEAGDGGPLAAAIREAEEEIGLLPQLVEPVGYLDTYVTITGYAVVPVVAFIDGGFEARLDPREVKAVFEVPLAHLLDPANQARRSRLLDGTAVPFVEIAYGDRRIWGATAAMLVGFARFIEKNIV